MLRVVVLALVCAVALGAASEWSFVRGGHADEMVTFTLALKQRNLDVLREAVTARSDSTNSLYGKWMTLEEVTALVSPLPAQRAALKSALAQRGIVVMADRGDSFVCNATAATIGRVFTTAVNVVAHSESKRQLHHIGHYTMPADLRAHVEFISDLPMLPKKSSVGAKRRTAKQPQPMDGDYGSAIPNFLRVLYNIPGTTFSPKSSLALVEFMDYNSYSKSNLEKFCKETNNPVWSVSKTVGAFSGDGLESVLDVQFGGTLARGATIWFWTGSRWLLDFAQSFFATSQVPSVVSMSWGWPSDAMCSGSPPVANCSGSITSQQYTTRVDAEFMKIAARGVTLVGASGDQGAPGDDYYQLSDIMPASSLWVTAVGATQLGKAPKRRQVSRADASPFGAPICRSFFHPLGKKCADGTNKYEVVCSYGTGALITSGGGFQSYFAMPAWQQTAVKAYLHAAGSTLPPRQYFNASNRAFPDVSALGHNYLIYDSSQGGATDVDGTSASTPVFAAMVALWNSQRLVAGKSTLGHVAPLMYQIYAANPAAFNDVVVGDNKCTESCCSMGFTATAGWDAATGLGTPNWSKISTYIASLQ